jgi:hypothetical protein
MEGVTFFFEPTRPKLHERGKRCNSPTTSAPCQLLLVLLLVVESVAAGALVVSAVADLEVAVVWEARPKARVLPLVRWLQEVRPLKRS